jgi:hypothetical protein
MTSFAPNLAVPDRARPDPSKHVNYIYGMVLGVDDFDAEFAYLSGRDRWIVRDLSGYGTISGLRVRYEPGVEGTDRRPRLTVSSGVAASPSGQLICVAPDQCAYLEEWLQANREAVVRRLLGSPPEGSPPEGSPPTPPLAGGPLDLYVVLCYADCPTDRVPVPGEPCRNEEELKQPSRLRDDFMLELRFDPPDQPKEVAVRRFVGWLRQVPIVDGAVADVDDLVRAARAATGVPDPGGSPPTPSSPPGNGGEEACPPLEWFMATPPPPGLVIPRERIAEFLRAAFHLWTTELLPCWRAAACRSGCGNGSGPTGNDCVLLAHMVVDVLPDEATDRLLVGPGGVEVMEEWRPFLVDLRVLQEWAITGGAEAGWWPSPPGSPPGASMAAPHAAAGLAAPDGGGPVVVAGGRFDAAGNTPGPPYFAYGGLTAVQRAGSPDVYDLSFDDYSPAAPGDYVVSGSALTGETARAHTLEVLESDGGLAVRLRRVGTGIAVDAGFMLQITRFGGAGS